MKYQRLIAFFAILLVAACETLPKPVTPADLVISGGAVYTVNFEQAWAEAVAVRDGVIQYVGNNAGVQPYIDSATELVDLKGRLLMPGFHDAHIHTTMGGQMLNGCGLLHADTMDSLLSELADCQREMPGEWLLAEGFDISLFGENGPDKALLDRIVPDRPAVVGASDGHNLWVNSLALAAAGITAATPDPPKGVIERQTNGEPSGTLRESAMALVRAVQPEPSAAELQAAVKSAVSAMNEVGITSVLDAWVSGRDIAALMAVDRAGELTVRVNGALAYGYGDMFIAHSSGVYEAILNNRADYQTEHFRIGSVKLFADGVLEGETAALVDPYLGKGDHRGNLTFSQGELNRIVTDLDGSGMQIFIHSLGDGAVRASMDAFEVARARNGRNDLRHHLSHLQLIHPDDIHRFRELDLVANFQALWAYPDEYITKLNLPVVGQQRVDRMYPIKSVLDSGAVVVGGSDWSVSSMNPLEAIETGVLRSDANKNGTNRQGSGQLPVLNAAERVSVEDMVRAYTAAAAWSMHQDTISGTVEVGKRADLIVLSRNIFNLEPQLISEAQVDMTLLNGRVVYHRPGAR